MNACVTRDRRIRFDTAVTKRHAMHHFAYMKRQSQYHVPMTARPRFCDANKEHVRTCLRLRTNFCDSLFHLHYSQEIRDRVTKHFPFFQFDDVGTIF